MTMQTVYDVRCRVRVRAEIALPAGAGMILSGGTFRDYDKAQDVAARLSRYGAYVMPCDIPAELVDQVCDD